MGIKLFSKDGLKLLWRHLFGKNKSSQTEQTDLNTDVYQEKMIDHINSRSFFEHMVQKGIQNIPCNDKLMELNQVARLRAQQAIPSSPYVFAAQRQRTDYSITTEPDRLRAVIVKLLQIMDKNSVTMAISEIHINKKVELYDEIFDYGRKYRVGFNKIGVETTDEDSGNKVCGGNKAHTGYFYDHGTCHIVPPALHV